MPRDGSNVYHYPTGIEGEPNQTIQSAPYNSFLSDVEQDLNVPRPILAGGTGATNADAALTNLGGEAATQPVTNYDSYVFKPGSFYSTQGATGAPNSTDYFIGICYLIDSGTAVLEARDINPSANSPLYVRVKTGGVWGAWSDSNAVMDAKKVNRAGDTMTGNLYINTAGYSTLYLTSPAGAFSNQISGVKAGNARWLLRPGNDTAESGGNVGSNFDIYRYADNGAFLSRAFEINRATGATIIDGALTSGPHTVTGSILANVDVWAGNGQATGTYRFGNASTNFLSHDGTNFQMQGGILNVHDVIMSSGTGGANGAVWANVNATAGMLYDGTNLLMRSGAGSIFFQNGVGNINWGLIDGGGLTVTSGTITSNGGSFVSKAVGSNDPAYRLQNSSGVEKGVLYWDHATGDLNLFHDANGASIKFALSGSVFLGNGMVCKSGFGGSYGGNTINFQINSPLANQAVEIWGNNVFMGNVVPSTSDYRVKKDVIDLPGMWDTVKALRPIKYTHKESPRFAGDDIERWGFFAHELQETLIQSASTGVKDEPDALQTPNPFTVIAALTKALQEAMTRIEALEAR
jgi:hypothetical protein